MAKRNYTIYRETEDKLDEAIEYFKNDRGSERFFTNRRLVKMKNEADLWWAIDIEEFYG